jgi:hypothetical protein
MRFITINSGNVWSVDCLCALRGIRQTFQVVAYSRQEAIEEAVAALNASRRKPTLRIV